MISVTPFAQPEIAAKRATVIRTAVVAALGLTLIAILISQLANVSGDMLSASVLALAGLATAIAVLAPRGERRSRG